MRGRKFASPSVMTTWIGSVPEKGSSTTVSGADCTVMPDVKNALQEEPHSVFTVSLMRLAKLPPLLPV